MRYNFKRLIALSTWILALAIFLVFSTSLGVNWLEVRNGGIFTDTFSGRRSYKRKPSSARIISPGWKCSKIPQDRTIFLSDEEPGNNLEA